jgi:hypothetical protein
MFTDSGARQTWQTGVATSPSHGDWPTASGSWQFFSHWSLAFAKRMSRSVMTFKSGSCTASRIA